MSGENFLALEEVTKKPIYESLMWLSWLKDKNEEEVRRFNNANTNTYKS
tara:strand:- start:1082 stop:1228 length:147 start_codon:yes stop_codon:yes gene_type:complete